MQIMTQSDQALLRLSRKLVRLGYRHVTVTPETHARILARQPGRIGTSLVDIFGWSLPFDAGTLPDDLISDLHAAGMLDDTHDLLRSKVRFSTVRGASYWHSAFPTSGTDAVFLGPDSYRFANLITDELEARPLARNAHIVDIGVGAGVGAVTAAQCSPPVTLTVTDINPHALRLAGVNAAASGLTIDARETSGLDGVPGPFDLALLNPPYLMDDDNRAYRDGGGMHGAQLPLELALAALARLSPGGRLILYSGSAIVDGDDPFMARLMHAAGEHDCTLRYREIDPDVFADELARPQYADVDRIALVSAVFTRNG